MRAWSPLLIFQHQWGVPEVAGPELCPHGLCWATGSTELGTAVPAALHRQARDFSSMGKSEPPGGNKTTRSAVTCGNAHPSSCSSPSSLSCTSPEPGAGNVPFLGLPAQTGGEQPHSAPSRQSQEEPKPARAGSCHGSTAATSLPVPRPSHSWFLENQLPDRQSQKLDFAQCSFANKPRNDNREAAASPSLVSFCFIFSCTLQLPIVVWRLLEAASAPLTERSPEQSSTKNCVRCW